MDKKRVRILVLSPTASHAINLRHALEIQYSLVAVRQLGLEFWNLERLIKGYEIVIIDMTLDRASDWKTLERACRCKPMGGGNPGILAVSMVRRGARPQIKAERLGARWSSV